MCFVFGGRARFFLKKKILHEPPERVIYIFTIFLSSISSFSATFVATANAAKIFVRSIEIALHGHALSPKFTNGGRFNCSGC